MNNVRNRCRRRLLKAFCIVSCWVFAAGCNKGANTPSVSSAPTHLTNRPAAAVFPKLISIAPEDIEVRTGHASSTRFLVSYSIDSPDRVTKATLKVYSPGIGDVQSPIDVPVQASGTVEFILDTAEDFGPKVRFRVHCPSGDTDWYTFGSPPEPFDPAASGKMKISNVTPRYAASYGDTGADNGTLVTIWAGDMITPQCTTETQVDGREVELRNANAQYRQMQGLLMRSDVEERSIAARYLEFKLILKGANVAAEAIKQVLFSE